MKLYSFGLGESVTETSKEVLGGKGAGLVWMDSHGITVPPGFIIPTSECMEYLNNPSGTMDAISAAITPYLDKMTEKFGYMPLVSVRSGARVSMPGMMDTILNVGLDEVNAGNWSKRLGIECLKDSRKRLIEMFGSVVKGIDRSIFNGLSAAECREAYCRCTGEAAFPNAHVQLLASIEAVFRSWNNERAKVYRKMNNIPENWGTAVVVQAMVFGNMNDKSCTGVLFTRHPDTGENEVTGEFLVNAQGEDVVAGTATPTPLVEMTKWNEALADELLETVEKLETEKKDVQDVEFTVQDGKLFILQTRDAKRSPRAAIRIALDLLDEGLITKEDVFKRVKFRDFLRAQGDIVDPSYKKKPAFVGIPACSGIAIGKVVLTSHDAVKHKGPCILVTQETTPDDIAGMAAARGVLTMTGGMTSHAAVVARNMNRVCVVGLGKDLTRFHAGAEISIDGSTGRVWFEKIPVVSGKNDPYVARLNKLLEDSAKVKIIDQYDGDMLDLSDFLSPMEQVKAIDIVKVAAQSRDKLMIDVRPADNAAKQAFDEMFGGDPSSEAAFIKLILSAVPALKSKLTFVTNADEDALGKDVHLIANVKDYEDLFANEGDFVFSGKMTKGMKKALKWKAAMEGSKPVVFGEFVEGSTSYLSRAQLAHRLLAQ